MEKFNIHCEFKIRRRQENELAGLRLDMNPGWCNFSSSMNIKNISEEREDPWVDQQYISDYDNFITDFRDPILKSLFTTYY